MTKLSDDVDVTYDVEVKRDGDWVEISLSMITEVRGGPETVYTKFASQMLRIPFGVAAILHDELQDIFVDKEA